MAILNSEDCGLLGTVPSDGPVEEEVLTLIHLISPIITQHADSIQSGMDALKGQQVDTSLRLEENEPQRQLLVLGQKATAACLLLLLKQQLQSNYALSDSKLIAFNLSDNKSHHRVVQAVCKPLNTKGLPLGVSVEEALKQCKMFKKFLSESEAQWICEYVIQNGDVLSQWGVPKQVHKLISVSIPCKLATAISL